MTKRIALVLVVVGLFGAHGLHAAGAAPAVSQNVGGVATGQHGAILTPETTYTDSGAYHSAGQLGNGSYRIETTGDDCVNGSVALTGTATLHRADGAQLTGTASGRYGCPGTSSSSGASFPAT